MQPLVILALASAGVLFAVVWALRAARANAARLEAEQPLDEPSFAALPPVRPAPATPRPRAPGEPAPDRPPLVTVGGLSARDRTTLRSDTEGHLVSLLGVPEVLAAGEAGPLPQLGRDRASPFEGPDLELDAPEPRTDLELDPEPGAVDALDHRPRRGTAAVAALSVGGLAAFATGLAQGPPLVVAGFGLALGLGTFVLTGQLGGQRSQHRRDRAERELVQALPGLIRWLDEGGSLDGAWDALRDSCPPGGLLRAEVEQVRAAWSDPAERVRALQSARALGAEWPRVLWALDEAERTGADPRRLLGHTLTGLADRLGTG